jgi:hypothetical protein
MQAVLAADAAASARQHASYTFLGRAAFRAVHIAQPRLTGPSTKRAAGRFTQRVAAEGNSLEASYSTGSAAGGRSGAAQLREQPAGAVQAPLNAVAAPAGSGAVLQEAADYMRGELRRMFTTGVRKEALPFHTSNVSPAAQAAVSRGCAGAQDAQAHRLKRQQ